jgi:AcrR family transcriptional regulator
MSDPSDTRARILDAALQLIFEMGYDGTTTRAIAQRAGVNEVTLFRQFGNKRGILIAVIERETDITSELEEIRLEPSDDMKADLAFAGGRMIEEMTEKAKLVKIIMMEATKDPEIWEHVSSAPFQVLGRIGQYFNEAKGMGLMRDIDPELTAVAFFSFFFRSMVAHAFLGSDVFIDMDQATVGEFVDIFVNGIAAKGG